MRWLTATMLVGVFAVVLLAQEWGFRGRARAARAVVDGPVVYSRGGEVIAEGLHTVDGRTVRATLRAWFCRLRPGQRVGVLYLPGDAGNVVLDWFWQRHFGSTLALGVFAVLAYAEVQNARDRRRRHTIRLLGDDVLVPPVPARGPIRLPIDTAPRLWDRELDGQGP